MGGNIRRAGEDLRRGEEVLQRGVRYLPGNVVGPLPVAVIGYPRHHDEHREADAETCRQAGAQQVVNHRDDRFAQAVLDANGGKLVDRVVDVEFGANLPVSIEVLRIGGTIATYASMQVPEPKLPW